MSRWRVKAICCWLVALLEFKKTTTIFWWSTHSPRRLIDRNCCQLLLSEMVFPFLTGRYKRQSNSTRCIIGSAHYFDVFTAPALLLKTRQPIGQIDILQLSSKYYHIPLAGTNVNQTNTVLWVVRTASSRWLTSNQIGQRALVGRYLVWALQGFTESECRHERWVGIITLVFILLCYFHKHSIERMNRYIYFMS